ncbi:uncharacterized protein DUF3108 [Flavobacterium cauense R2A-7]|jgi:hypothetical protein|uniref:Uncharacterized protein DUF3108 n=1 Tax=Flavobacterium cauense R2A-7 TaxID=1341154 RepID=A0A562LP01_9FLAO|nr:DUF3108 domain-containing protein [Flavobacterium cauense]KGO80339.1 ATP-dependent exonuclease [Flavobacterium cauense R2A-7]TWI09342.1 uncharacterized protein DUF3108 [Flavobacterium cauense R2A-7]
MKKFITLLSLSFLLLFAVSFTVVDQEDAFTTGEFFKFRIHYGLVNAGYATLEVKEAVRNNKKVHHVVGKGYTVGMTKFFFKVQDDYQSIFDKQTGQPYQYLRKIDEGGYTKNQEGFFNQTKNTVLVKDYKNNTEKTFSVTENVQDIVSSFYYLRNHPKIDKLAVGESILIDMFFDDEVFKFKLKYLGKEDIDTKFGVIPTLVFRPYVQSGRVFKEQESLTVWISDDDNKMPIRIKASLAVGSLKADLDGFKGLKNSFKVKVK